MQVGDLVARLGRIGIVLQLAPQEAIGVSRHLIQIKWLDGCADSYWYHPSHLETLVKS